ncbi:MAG: branched-chain amino acid ABC transporter permease [Acidimicrobiia bacterium]|nr:branched-chain amino acid ABC transporter permease [Acidimicrobiia bacterium]MDH4307219.1 branched-chain amino acid ABC transporter permease [Acidimicrobiia bacterium]MDH5292835.1 branched-chain amino acid ABC transporter permease [Acidimicrobiia bacterium]
MTGILLFFVGVLTLAGVYAIFAMILNLEAGWAGMWDLGLVGSVAVGSYTYSILTQTKFDDVTFAPELPIWMGMIGAALAAGIFALIIGLPSLRVRGEYFLITTLAFAEVVHQIAVNAKPLTRGTVGFSELARPFETVVGGTANRIVLLATVWVGVGLMYLLMRRLAHSPYGRLLRGFRDNDPVARSLGKATNRHRIQTYVLVGALYGLTAPMYLWYLRSATPSLFKADITFVTWTALVIGGIASKKGPVLGAVVLLVLTESVSLVQGSADLAVLLASSRFVVLGLLLILVMRFRPNGLVEERAAFAGASGRGGG